MFSPPPDQPVVVHLRSGKTFQGTIRDAPTSPYFYLDIGEETYLIPWTSVEWVRLD